VSLSIPRSQLLKAIRLDVQIIFLVAVENNIAVEFWSEDIIIFKRIDTEFMERRPGDALSRLGQINQR